jgi:hypothetical protein
MSAGRIGSVITAVTKEEERLNRLRRRCDWLEARIAKAKAKGQDVSFDVAEASALHWAIERIATSHDDLWTQNRKLQHRICNQRKLIKHLLTRQQLPVPTDQELDALIESQASPEEASEL